MNKRNVSIIPLIACLCIIVMLAGCGTTTNPGTTTGGTTTGTTTAGTTTLGTTTNTTTTTQTGTGTAVTTGTATGTTTGTNTQGANGTNQMFAFNSAKADTLVSQLGTVAGVSQVTAVVNGNTALIGYKPTSTAQSPTTAQTAITNRVKQLDNSITNVVVTGSDTVRSSIAQLATDVKTNTSGTDLTNRFNQIVQSAKSAGL